MWKHRERCLFFYLPLLAGVVLTISLFLYGQEYYLLPESGQHQAQDLKDYFGSSGLWGHGVGIVATLIMLLNFFYFFRKRFLFLKVFGKNSHWLNIHAVIGLLTPVFILFHAAFKMNNLFSKLTYFAMIVVVVTGIVGRFFYEWTESHPEKVSRLTRSWRLIHSILAVFMLQLLIAHIAISLYVGYWWIF